MLFYTHILFGIFFFLLFSGLFFARSDITFLLLVLIGAAFPDIDERRSTAARSTGFIGRTISFFVKHRGIFHSLPFGVFVSLLVGLFSAPLYGWALFLGYVSHLLGDMITPMGIRPFYPYSLVKFRGPIKVGSFGEGIISLLLAVVVLRLIL